MKRNILVCSGFFACFEICQVLFVLFGCVALVRVFPDLSSVQQHAYQSDGGQDQENYESVSYPRKQRQTYDLLGNTGWVNMFTIPQANPAVAANMMVPAAMSLS